MTKHEDDLNVPEFLKRTETEEQADKRRKKYKPKDPTGGLKVVEPYAPPPEAVRKAIEKDLKKDSPTEVTELIPYFKEAIEQVAKTDVERIKTAKINTKLAAEEKSKLNALKRDKSAVEKINEARAKDGLRPYQPKREKKLPPAIAKAVAEKEAREQKSEILRPRMKDSFTPEQKRKLEDQRKKHNNEVQKATSVKTKSHKKSMAAKIFTDDSVKAGIAIIKRKSGASNEELQKLMKCDARMVRRFVRDVVRKKHHLSVVCDRSGEKKVYKIA